MHSKTPLPSRNPEQERCLGYCIVADVPRAATAKMLKYTAAREAHSISPRLRPASDTRDHIHRPQAISRTALNRIGQALLNLQSTPQRATRSTPCDRPLPSPLTCLARVPLVKAAVPSSRWVYRVLSMSSVPKDRTSRMLRTTSSARLFSRPIAAL